MTAIDDIMEERTRQQVVERWTTEHDDEHIDGSLAAAAGCYALKAGGVDFNISLLGRLWPWDLKWWKPTANRQSCVKAAALLVAEIERIDRKMMKGLEQ